jgi:hypothetical protein
LKQIWQKNLSAKKWSTDIHRRLTIFLPLDFFAIPFVLTGTAMTAALGVSCLS